MGGPAFRPRPTASGPQLGEAIDGLGPALAVLHAADGAITVELNGAIASMIEAAQPGALDAIDACSAKVVAGARNSRFLRLVEGLVPRLVA